MSTLLMILKTFFDDLNEADNFRGNWYGYATNQLSHFTLGFLFSACVSYVGYSVYGEFCYKPAILSIVAVLYILLELTQTGKKNWVDSVEDTLFFVVYGAGSSILLFDPLSEYSSAVTTDVKNVVPVTGAIVCHLAVGIVTRIYTKIKEAKNDG